MGEGHGKPQLASVLFKVLSDLFIPFNNWNQRLKFLFNLIVLVKEFNKFLIDE